MSELVHQTTDSNFKADVLESSVPVLVDFWAEWCGPCKALTPVLEETAADFGDKVKVVKVNIDENPETPSQFGVMSIPTMILFKNGNVEATKVGLVSKSQLAAFIESNL
jgi:thioredoxin 1